MARSDSPSVAKIVFSALGIFLVVALVVWALGFVFSWWGAATKVIGPQNVSQQFQLVINDYQSLQTAAANACDVTQAGSTADPNNPLLVEDPTLAYAATYRRIAVDYNRRQSNIFEAQKVGPSGYPKEVPVTTTDWCTLVDTLQNARD